MQNVNQDHHFQSTSQFLNRTRYVNRSSGSFLNCPENTLTALNKTIENEAVYFEMDIRMSLDDSIMVILDEKIEWTTNGAGRVHQLSYEELKGYLEGYDNKFGKEYSAGKIPSLSEMLSGVKGKTGVCIDLKNVLRYLLLRLPLLISSIRIKILHLSIRKWVLSIIH